MWIECVEVLVADPIITNGNSTASAELLQRSIEARLPWLTDVFRTVQSMDTTALQVVGKALRAAWEVSEGQRSRYLKALHSLVGDDTRKQKQDTLRR